MSVDFVNKTGAGIVFDTRMDRNRPGKPTPQPSGCVIAEGVEGPSLPTVEGLPVEIRVKIYRYILISDKDISLRSAPEMRTQIGPRGSGNHFSVETWTGIRVPTCFYLLGNYGGHDLCPVVCAPQFSLLQNAGILCVSRKINQEATDVFCANNNFHYSCMRSFPGATIDLLQNLPWPVPFSGMQLQFMKNLSLDYCNSHYDRWTDAAVDDMDQCMARNIMHISEACPNLKTFSLYIFSRPPLTGLFLERLRTGQTAPALRKLRKRLDWLNLVATWSAVAVFGETIAPEAVWERWEPHHSQLPQVTISKWQLEGMAFRRGIPQIWRLDCKEAMEEEVGYGDAGSEDAEIGGGSLADADQCGDEETYGDSMFGSGEGERGKMR
ncbi:MAG: hypothetical protein Q9161_007318 [Pseudevernia consocians]